MIGILIVFVYTYIAIKKLCNAYDLLLYRCLHYFHTSEKLSLHIVDCTTTNDYAIILPNENDKWLSFRGHNKKERLLFVPIWSVYWRRRPKMKTF